MWRRTRSGFALPAFAARAFSASLHGSPDSSETTDFRVSPFGNHLHGRQSPALAERAFSASLHESPDSSEATDFRASPFGNHLRGRQLPALAARAFSASPQGSPDSNEITDIRASPFGNHLRGRQLPALAERAFSASPQGSPDSNETTDVRASPFGNHSPGRQLPALAERAASASIHESPDGSETADTTFHSGFQQLSRLRSLLDAAKTKPARSRGAQVGDAWRLATEANAMRETIAELEQEVVELRVQLDSAREVLAPYNEQAGGSESIATLVCLLVTELQASESVVKQLRGSLSEREQQLNAAKDAEAGMLNQLRKVTAELAAVKAEAEKRATIVENGSFSPNGFGSPVPEVKSVCKASHEEEGCRPRAIQLESELYDAQRLARFQEESFEQPSAGVEKQQAAELPGQAREVTVEAAITVCCAVTEGGIQEVNLKQASAGIEVQTVRSQETVSEVAITRSEAQSVSSTATQESVNRTANERRSVRGESGERQWNAQEVRALEADLAHVTEMLREACAEVEERDARVRLLETELATAAEKRLAMAERESRRVRELDEKLAEVTGRLGTLEKERLPEMQRAKALEAEVEALRAEAAAQAERLAAAVVLPAESVRNADVALAEAGYDAWVPGELLMTVQTIAGDVKALRARQAATAEGEQANAVPESKSAKRDQRSYLERAIAVHQSAKEGRGDQETQLLEKATGAHSGAWSPREDAYRTGRQATEEIHASLDIQRSLIGRLRRQLQRGGEVDMAIRRRVVAAILSEHNSCIKALDQQLKAYGTEKGIGCRGNNGQQG